MVEIDADVPVVRHNVSILGRKRTLLKAEAVLYSNDAASESVGFDKGGGKDAGNRGETPWNWAHYG